MDYEKLYKEALERARNLHKDAIDMGEKLHAKQCEIIFPELKESEDERIRKALLRFHKSTIDIDGIKCEDILAWLEKQGEQPTIEMKSAEESLGIDSDTYNKIVDECIYGDDKSTWSKSELKEREQKPADTRTTGYWHVEDAMKEVEEKAEAFTNAHQGENADEILAQMRGEKNSTWSEEDEKLLNEVIELIDAGALDREEKDNYINRLKSLKDRVQPQQEWSEEDENVLEDIEEAIINYWHGDTQDILLDWLKSLKPQNRWKPSKEHIDYGTDRKKEID